jgi:hypothetical protein
MHRVFEDASRQVFDAVENEIAAEAERHARPSQVIPLRKV